MVFVSHMKMEFSFIPSPKCHHLHLEYPGDALDNPAQSCRLLRLCSTLRNYRPEVLSLSNACEDSGILAEDVGMFYVSVSLPTDLSFWWGVYSICM